MFYIPKCSGTLKERDTIVISYSDDFGEEEGTVRNIEVCMVNTIPTKEFCDIISATIASSFILFLKV